MKARGLAPLLVASLVHCVAMGALLATKRSAPVVATTAANAGEIDLEPLPADPPESVDAPSTTPRDEASTPRGAAHTGGGAKAKVDSTPAKQEPMATSRGDAPVSEPPSDGWSFNPAALHVDVSHAYTPDLSKHDAHPSDVAAPTSTSTTGGLAEGLAANDVDKGLGRGGSVLTAAENAARSSEAPLRGEATFDVVVRPNGAVEARLASASSDGDAWREVAGVIQRSIDGKRVRVPHGSRGVRVVVHVEAKVVLADGRDTQSLHGLRGAVAPSALQNAIEGKPGARGSSTGPGGPDHVSGEGGDAPPVGGALGPEKPAHVGASVAIGTLMRILPTPTVSVEGKVCSATLSITPVGVGIGGGCSLENIGNGTSRKVSGRIVREEVL